MLRKEITFFYTDLVELQTTQPIADKAINSGYKVKFTKDISEKAEIGVYCQHKCFPKNSRLSLIVLHDMAQGHNRWPNFWEEEPWNEFDIGILPGNSWVERWQECSWDTNSRPKLGTFKLGWPKADIIFNNTILLQKQIDNLRDSLNFRFERTVLYAPSWENDNKQDDVVQAISGLPINLLLKQAPWSNDFPKVIQSIKEMNELHYNYAENVYVISPEINIFLCLALSDVILSDESSVMTEGLLLDIPSVAVVDWLIPDCSPPRNPIVSADFIVNTTRAEIKNSITTILNNLQREKIRIKAAKDRHFCNLGHSSEDILLLIDSVVNNRCLPFKPVPSVFDLKRLMKKKFYITFQKVKKYLVIIKHSIRRKLSLAYAKIH